MGNRQDVVWEIYLNYIIYRLNIKHYNEIFYINIILTYSHLIIYPIYIYILKKNIDSFYKKNNLITKCLTLINIMLKLLIVEALFKQYNSKINIQTWIN